MLLLLAACIPVLHTPGGDSGEASLACGETLPENTWPSEEPTVSGSTGFDEGDVVPDACLVDQYGANVDLWQFYGQVWVLDVSTMWCSPCQEIAGGAQDMADGLRDEGFVYVTVLPENVQGEVPSQDDLGVWSSTFGITEPILSDATTWSEVAVPSHSFPDIWIIDRDLTIASQVTTISDEAIQAAAEDAL